MRLKGVYTVEAAIIMSFCIIVFSQAICLSYNTFAQSMDRVSSKQDYIQAVEMFRTKETAENAFGFIKEKIKEGKK